jgi:hypothetical protein
MSDWYALPRKISAKTAAYQVVEKDFATFFTTRGNGATITFTLPLTSTLLAGWWCEFFNVVDYEFIIASYGSSDDIVSLADINADSITFTTDGEQIGISVRVTWDGTGWLAQMLNPEAITVTVA